MATENALCKWFFLELAVAALYAAVLPGCCICRSFGTVEPALDADGVVVNGRTVADTEWRHEPDGVAVRYRLPDGARAGMIWTLGFARTAEFEFDSGNVEFLDVFGKSLDVKRGQKGWLLQLSDSPIYFRGAHIKLEK